MAVTGLAALFQSRRQGSREVQQVAETSESKQIIAAHEQRIRQLEQANAARSGWFSGWRSLRRRLQDPGDCGRHSSPQLGW